MQQESGVRMKVNVLHIMNSISPTSTEYEIVSRLNSECFNPIIVSYLGITKVDDLKIINLNAEGKLDYKAIIRLNNVFRNNRVDILHTHHNISGSIARILAKKYNIPVIIDTEHGSHSRYKLIGNIFNDMTLFLSDKIVNVSQWVNDSYCLWEKLFIPKGKMCIIYNGVDMEKVNRVLKDDHLRISIRREYSIAEGDLLFIHAARLTGIKNQSKMIAGFAQVIKKYPNIKLMLIGDGDLSNRLQKLVKNLGVDGNIIFTGLVSRERVYQLMKEADGFVMNSLSEGLSVALLEAMAFGLPCILSNIPSFKETVRGCNIGEFIEKNNVRFVAEAFIRFISTDRNRLQKKGEIAKQLVRDFYSIENTVKAYENIYIELLSKKKRDIEQKYVLH